MLKKHKAAYKIYSRVIEVATHSQAAAVLFKADNLVLIVRGVPRALKMRCPCSCGEIITIPIDPSLQIHWTLIRSSENDISISPSVWRETGCKSHFVLWKSNVYMWGCRTRAKKSRSEATRDFAEMLKEIPD